MLNLICNQDTIHISQGYIGFTTTSLDSINYDSKSGLGAMIYKISQDTLFIKTPVEYRDTLIPMVNQGLPKMHQEFRYLGAKRINKTRTAKVLLIDKYLYQYIEIDSITSIRYPPKGCETPPGCIFCIAIPIYNLFWLKSLRAYHKPETYLIPCWKLEEN